MSRWFTIYIEDPEKADAICVGDLLAYDEALELVRVLEKYSNDTLIIRKEISKL